MKTSIAMCTYNGEKYVKEQIESILWQSCPVDEIIVSDDNSSDATLEIVQSTLQNADISYRIYTHDTNVGVTQNFWECIVKCTGEVIFTCDQDDVWKKEKVEIMLKCFDDPDVSLAFSDAEIVDADLCSQNRTQWQALGVTKEQLDSDLFAILSRRNVVSGMSMAFRRCVFEETGSALKGYFHDEWLAINAYGLGRVCAVDTCLVYYRQHANNVVGALNAIKMVKEPTLSEKIKNYLYSISFKQRYKQPRIKFYEEFLKQPHIHLKEDEEKNLRQYIRFSNENADLTTKSVLQALVWIAKNYLNGNYIKYYTTGGAVRDVLLSFHK